MDGYYERTVPASPDYAVFLETAQGSVPLFVYCAHQHQPGAFNYDSELESFAQWPCDGPARVRVEVRNPEIQLQNVVVRPRKAGVYAQIDPAARRLTLALDGSRTEHRILSVEIDGTARPLFLFLNPPETGRPDKDDPRVHVFAPAQSDDEVLTQRDIDSALASHDVLFFPKGVHNIEYFAVRRDNQTYYLEEGAVLRLRSGRTESEFRHHTVRSGIRLQGSRIRILGRGIIDGKVDTDAFSKPLTCGGFVLTLEDCANVRVEGLIFTHSLGFCLVGLHSRDLVFRGVKMAGSQDMTSNDGILIDGCHNALVEQCFANNHDDSLEVKTHHYAKSSTEQVVFQDCVVWSRGGMPLAAAWENWYDIKNITWRRISVIHHENYGNGALCVYVGNRGRVDGLLFEDIDVEGTPFGGIAVNVEQHPWSYWGRDFAAEAVGERALSEDPDDNWSMIGNIHFKNITIRHTEGFHSDFYPKPKPPGNGNGHGGKGYKLHIPMPGFSSGKTRVLAPHMTGKITFENVLIETYRDHNNFTRYGRGEDHYAGRPIARHYLSDLTTDRWILWEGVNPQLWELIDGMSPERVYSPEPDEKEKLERLKFWEDHVVFITPEKQKSHE